MNIVAQTTLHSFLDIKTSISLILTSKDYYNDICIRNLKMKRIYNASIIVGVINKITNRIIKCPYHREKDYMNNAIKRGWLFGIKYFLCKNPHYRFRITDAVILAIRHHHVHIVKFFLSFTKIPRNYRRSIVEQAIIGGDIDIIKLLIEKGMQCGSEYLCYASNMKMINFLVSELNCNPSHYSKETLVNAIYNNYIDIVKYILPICFEDLFCDKLQQFLIEDALDKALSKHLSNSEYRGMFNPNHCIMDPRIGPFTETEQYLIDIKNSIAMLEIPERMEVLTRTYEKKSTTKKYKLMDTTRGCYN